MRWEVLSGYGISFLLNLALLWINPAEEWSSTVAWILLMLISLANTLLFAFGPGKSYQLLKGDPAWRNGHSKGTFSSPNMQWASIFHSQAPLRTYTMEDPTSGDGSTPGAEQRLIKRALRSFSPRLPTWLDAHAHAADTPSLGANVLTLTVWNPTSTSCILFETFNPVHCALGLLVPHCYYRLFWMTVQVVIFSGYSHLWRARQRDLSILHQAMLMEMDDIIHNNYTSKLGQFAHDVTQTMGSSMEEEEEEEVAEEVPKKVGGVRVRSPRVFG